MAVMKPPLLMPILFICKILIYAEVLFTAIVLMKDFHLTN